MSTFLTGVEDEEEGALSAVDLARHEHVEYRARYERAVAEHEEAAREAARQLEEAQEAGQREAGRAARAEALAEREGARAGRAEAGRVEALGCAARERAEHEQRSAVAAAAAEEAAAKAAEAHGAEVAALEARLEGAERAVAERERELEEGAAREEGLRARVEELGLQRRRAVEEAARWRGVAGKVAAAARRHAEGWRAGLEALKTEQRGGAAAQASVAGQLRAALAGLEEARAEAAREAEATGAGLRREARRTNQETMEEVARYGAKLEGLRQQLVEVDNEKCTAAHRAASLERECAALR
jgi:colicin import membrane protein